MLPALLQTANLALLSAAIPLASTLTSTALAVAIEEKGSHVIRNPTTRDAEIASSLHVFAFTSLGDLVLAESEGNFTLEEWNKLHDMAQQQCQAQPQSADVDMDASGHPAANMGDFTRSIVEEQVASDLHWK
jgi:exosome complex component RRP46